MESTYRSLDGTGLSHRNFVPKQHFQQILFRADRKLKNLRDLNGNSLTIAPDGVTSSAGNLKIAFTRDTQGRITKITDPLGKEIFTPATRHSAIFRSPSNPAPEAHRRSRMRS